MSVYWYCSKGPHTHSPTELDDPESRARWNSKGNDIFHIIVPHPLCFSLCLLHTLPFFLLYSYSISFICLAYHHFCPPFSLPFIPSAHLSTSLLSPTFLSHCFYICSSLALLTTPFLHSLITSHCLKSIIWIYRIYFSTDFITHTEQDQNTAISYTQLVVLTVLLQVVSVSWKQIIPLQINLIADKFLCAKSYAIAVYYHLWNVVWNHANKQN